MNKVLLCSILKSHCLPIYMLDHDEINSILDVYPSVDLMASSETVLKSPDGTSLRFVTKKIMPSDDAKLVVSENFFTTNLALLDQTILYWCFPPTNVARQVLYRILDSKIPALVCIEHKATSAWIWKAVKHNCKFWNFCFPRQLGYFHVANTPMKAKSKHVILVTESAFHLQKHSLCKKPKIH